jgi:Flp pilus assembly protein TadG
MVMNLLSPARTNDSNPDLIHSRAGGKIHLFSRRVLTPRLRKAGIHLRQAVTAGLIELQQFDIPATTMNTIRGADHSPASGRKRGRARSGSVAIEFALIAPVLALFLFGIIETGVIFFAQSALQNAADDAARLVRTGQAQSNAMTEAQYAQQICGEMSGLVSTANCTSNLQVDMQSFTDFSSANYNNVMNPNGTLNAKKMQYLTGGACDVVLVRAFYPWSIMTPLLSPLLSNMPNGQYLLTAATAFRNEPYASGASC